MTFILSYRAIQKIAFLSDFLHFWLGNKPYFLFPSGSVCKFALHTFQQNPMIFQDKNTQDVHKNLYSEQ